MIVIFIVALVVFVLADIRDATRRRIAELPPSMRAAASQPCPICSARPFLDACDEQLHAEWKR